MKYDESLYYPLAECIIEEAFPHALFLKGDTKNTNIISAIRAFNTFRPPGHLRSMYSRLNLIFFSVLNTYALNFGILSTNLTSFYKYFKILKNNVYFSTEDWDLESRVAMFFHELNNEWKKVQRDLKSPIPR